LHNAYSSPNIIKVLVDTGGTCSTNRIYIYKFLLRNLKGRRNMGDLGVDGRIIIGVYLRERGCE
jgi:hypothetical protein